MKLKFNRRKIADNCTVLAYLLTIIITLLSILAIADVIFKWNILSDQIQRLAYLFMWATVVVVFASFLISLMVNLSIISQSLESIADRLSKQDDNEKHH